MNRVRWASVAAVMASVLGCGAASDDGEAPVERRICDGSSDVRLALGYGVGGMIYPFTSVLYELGFDFLYVDGNCHYWTQPPSVVPDDYYLWRPYREGVLTAEQEHELHDTLGYDDIAARECASRSPALDAGGAFLWDGSEMRTCADWNLPANWPLRRDLYDAGSAMTGPMRLQVGSTNIPERQVAYDWPLEAPIAEYVIDYGETRSFRVDDAAAVMALRALRERAIVDAAAAPGYFIGLIAIGPREGSGSHVLSLRDELPFVDARGSWNPELPTNSTAGDDSISPVDRAVTQAQCDEWSNSASLGRVDAQESADRSCSADADCTIVDFGVRCFADCGFPSAVALAAVPAIQARVLSLESEHCAPFEERGCPAPIAPPCTPSAGAPLASCRSGQCTLDFEPLQ